MENYVKLNQSINHITCAFCYIEFQAPGPINFTMFLTLFGEKLNGTDPEDVIRNAFGCFDLKSLGKFINCLKAEIKNTLISLVSVFF